MRVLLRPEVFVARYRVELMVLLWLGGSGRHRVIPDPLDGPEYGKWIAALDTDTRTSWEEMVEGSLERERIRAAHWEIAITTHRDPAWSHATPHVGMREALDMLLQPYRIVLENNVNDRAFFLALCGTHEARVLRECEQRGWVIFEMGGGSTTKLRVEQSLCTCAKVSSTKWSKQNSKRSPRNSFPDCDDIFALHRTRPTEPSVLLVGLIADMAARHATSIQFPQADQFFAHRLRKSTKRLPRNIETRLKPQRAPIMPAHKTKPSPLVQAMT